jgi:hypothetical protein
MGGEKNEDCAGREKKKRNSKVYYSLDVEDNESEEGAMDGLG